MKKIYVSIASIVACGLGFASQAAIGAMAPSDYQMLGVKEIKAFKLQPRFNFWAESGNYTLGKGQVLVPFYGDQSQAFYGIAEGSASLANKGWYAGGGLGYRGTVSDGMLLGGYAIVDYSRPTNGNTKFWVANPGIELMGADWDASANVYIPFRSSKVTYSVTDWAENFGIHDYEQFSGHTEYDRMMQSQNWDEAAKGVDVRIGKNIPNFEQVKVTVGGYYFKPKDLKGVTGGLAKLSYDLNKYASLELNDSYDNFNHNKVLMGLKLVFGGYSKDEKKDFGVSARLLDPIEHGYLSSIVPVQSHVGAPVLFGDKKLLHHDNLWFFKPGATTGANSVVGDGTYEHPFVGFTSDNFGAVHSIGTIDKHPLMYFAPGQYSFSGFTANSWANTFALPSGWGMFGRSSDYKSAAVNDKRATFTGALYLTGGSNIIDSVMFDYKESTNVSANSVPDAIVNLSNAPNVTMRNVQIGTKTDDSYRLGILLDNSTLNLYDTSVYTTRHGIDLGSNSKIDFKGGTNLVFAANEDTANSAAGISAYDNSIVSFSGGNNTVTVSHPVWSYGLYAINNSSLSFTGGTNSINAAGSNVSGGSVNGVYVANTSGLNFTGGTNNINVVGSGAVTGVFTTNKSQVNFLNGTNSIKVVGNGTSATGIVLTSSSLLFDSGVNDVDVSSSASSSGGTNQAIGVNNNLSSIIFRDGKNKIVASASNNVNAAGAAESYAIFSHGTGATGYSNSFIAFTGGINYLEGITNTSVGAMMNAYGIGCGDYTSVQGSTNITITGGNNTLKGVATNSSSSLNTSIFAGGVYAGDYSSVNIIGGTNSFIGMASSGAAVSSGGYYYSTALELYSGAAPNTSYLNIAGGTNSLQATIGTTGEAYGIYDAANAGGHNVYQFSGGTTSISLTNSDGDDNYSAYGMYILDNSQIWNGTTQIDRTQSASVVNAALAQLLVDQNISIGKTGTPVAGYKVLWGDATDGKYLTW